LFVPWFGKKIVYGPLSDEFACHWFY